MDKAGGAEEQQKLKELVDWRNGNGYRWRRIYLMRCRCMIYPRLCRFRMYQWMCTAGCTLLYQLE